MASIIKKKIKGQIYYYLVESKRINGKPKYTNQTYLGKAEDILEKLKSSEESQKPQDAVAYSFGAETALLQLAERLDLVSIINRHVGKRSQGISVGEYLLLAAINRAVAPTSKNKIADWYGGTVLKRLFRYKNDQLTSQRFWDNMDLVKPEHIAAVEAELTAKMVKEFEIDLECLLYDATNFFTYVDTNNDCKLPQRGHCKSKRTDLRIVGLALLVSRDFHIPLFHETYAGNLPDPVQFGSVSTKLIERVKKIQENLEAVTLVFDKGNNSLDNHRQIHGSVIRVVGSLVQSHHADVLQIPKSEFVALNEAKYPGVSVYRMTKEVFEQERTVLVIYNEKLFLGQMQGINKDINKCTLRLQELSKRLKNRETGVITKGKKPTVESVEKRTKEILSDKYMKRLFDVNIYEESGFPRLSFAFKQKSLEDLQEVSLGKTILFTDNHEWTNEAIVDAYRGQYKIEDAFKLMKNPHFLSWSPQFHWTDQKIMVHTFYCILALTLCSLLSRELSRNELNISIPAMLEELAKIKEVLTLHGKTRQGKKQRHYLTITKMNDVQKKMFDTFNLQQFQCN